MRETQADILRKNLWNFCKAHEGKQVFVGGMWTGDFIGTIISFSTTEATFDVVKPIGGDAGGRYTLPYSNHLNLRELTDAERQLDIAEVYGTVEVG